jgi:hypothetical protein
LVREEARREIEEPSTWSPAPLAVSLGMASWQLFVNVAMSFPLASYLIAVAIVCGIIEMPSCCGCFKWCEILAKGLRVVFGYWVVRGIFYVGALGIVALPASYREFSNFCLERFTGVSAAGYTIYSLHPAPSGTTGDTYGSMLLCVILFTVAALFYLVATILREPNPASTGDDSGRGEKDAGSDSKTGAPKADSGGSGGGLFGFFSQEKRDKAIAKGVAAGALTAGQAMFASDSDPPASAKAPTDSKAGMFTGGSLFPASSKYGGFGNDNAEANPFLA